jgi:glycosyltransferase involved in cell wall biosynthesis
MSPRPIVFDLTRLSTRAWRAAPNGIDRVDLAYARHFLPEAPNVANRAVSLGLRGVRLFDAECAGRAVAAVAQALEERDDATTLQAVSAFLRNEHGRLPRPPARRVAANRGDRMRAIARVFSAMSPLAGSSPRADAPHGAVYLNVSQFPVWIDSYFRWTDERPDIKRAFFVHDVLPLDFPEYFPDGEPRRHRRRLEVLSRRATGLVVASQSVRDRLSLRLAEFGRNDLPIHVGLLPAHPIFSTASDPPAGCEQPYFVVCGTIEPRKNHLLLLHIWRELAAELGPATPKLVLVGSRGWKNEHVVQLLDVCPAFKDTVLEISGLGTPSLKRLFDGARALLMPSFGEGFGLPAAEGLAAGVPIVASTIPSLLEIAGGQARFLDPLDGPGWKSAIVELMQAPRVPRPAAALDAAVLGRSAWEAYFRDLQAFLDAL